MKTKLNELRLEAGISRLHDEPKFMVAVSKEGTVIEPLDGLEKFAELIVRECAKLCIDEIADPRDTVEQKCAVKIMKHFEINNDRS